MTAPLPAGEKGARGPRRAMKINIPLLGLIWLASVVSGLGVLTAYEYGAGRDAGAPADWPAGSQIPLAADEPTLILFAHPDCPCTRASIGELAVLLARCPAGVRAHVVFLHPTGTGPDWMRTDLWRSAAAIPGVAVEADEGGREAARFQAATSGQVVLYGPDGRLMFHGGITGARGHYGDNEGLATIVELLRHEPAAVARTPVFGCSLLDPAPAAITKGAPCRR